MLLQGVGPNECALVAISAMLNKPIAEVQALADRICMLDKIRMYGTAPEETKRLVGLFGWEATLLFPRSRRIALSRCIEDLQQRGMTRATFCVRDFQATTTLHAVSICPEFGYVDLREQHYLAGVAEPTDPAWVRCEAPRFKPDRRVLWYLVLHDGP